MHEILRTLRSGAVVLDLGCRGGSFDSGGSPFRVIRVDLERDHLPHANSAQADAARLPFADRSFDAVICNHSLEHFAELTKCLEEIGRVIRSDGALYVAVPDSTTISDRLYRWLARGGGHVNGFNSSRELASNIERLTGLRHVATRTLCTSLSFLNRRNSQTRPPKRLLLLGGGTQPPLLFLTYVCRLLDRYACTRTSLYGWALYFGNVRAPVDQRVWTNVCVRCGSGHPSEWLERRHLARLLLFRVYQCPACGTSNLFTDDRNYANLNPH